MSEYMDNFAFDVTACSLATFELAMKLWPTTPKRAATPLLT